MLLPPLAVHESLHAIRFFAGLRQTAMSEILGMTQGWLSKCESGIGDVTVEHLIRLKKEFGISSDSIIDGNLPYMAIAKKYGFKPKLPDRYAGGSGTSLRVFFGFLRHFEKKLGRAKIDAFWKKLGMPAEILAEPSYPVHVRLLVDVVEFGVEQKVLSSQRDWHDVVALNLALYPSSSKPEQIFADCKDVSSFFRRFLDLSAVFTRDLGFTLKKSSKNSAEITVRSSPELTKLAKEDSIAVQRLITSYSRALLRKAGEYACGGKLSIKDSDAAKGLNYRVSW